MTDNQYVVVNGVRHWYRCAGDHRSTTPLVVVHGGPGGTIFDFERLTGPLLEEHVPVIYYEQRGSGRSDPPPDGRYSLPLLADDLEGLRLHLGIPRMSLLGISFGADLAAEYAVTHPELVERLVLHGSGLAGPLATSPQAAGFDAVAANDTTRMAIRAAAAKDGADGAWTVVDQPTGSSSTSRVSASRVRELWARSGLRNAGEMARELAGQPPHRDRPLIDVLAEADIPTLVLVGLWDRNAGVDACRDLVTRLHHGRLRIFHQSAHFPNVEETVAYVDEVVRFLGR